MLTISTWYGPTGNPGPTWYRTQVLEVDGCAGTSELCSMWERRNSMRKKIAVAATQTQCERTLTVHYFDHIRATEPLCA